MCECPHLAWLGLDCLTVKSTLLSLYTYVCVCGFHVHITGTYIYVRLKGRSKSGSNLGSWERRSIVIPWILLWSKKLSKIDKVLWAYHKFFEAADINSSYFAKFVEVIIAEMFQHLSCKSWRIEEKVPGCFQLTFLHTTLTVVSLSACTPIEQWPVRTPTNGVRCTLLWTSSSVDLLLSALGQNYLAVPTRTQSDIIETRAPSLCTFRRLSVWCRSEWSSPNLCLKNATAIR